MKIKYIFNLGCASTVSQEKEHALKGCLTDPWKVHDMYIYITGKGKKTLQRCVRSTSQLEGLHPTCHKIMKSSNTGLLLAGLMYMWVIFIVSERMCL